VEEKIIAIMTLTRALWPSASRALKLVEVVRGVVAGRSDATDNAGVSKTLWSVADLAEMVDATLPKLGKRGPYKKEEISN